MTGGDARELDAIDRGLERLFSESPTPGDLTAHVLLRIEEERWRRESKLGQLFNAWLCAAGALMIAAIGIVLTAVGQGLS